MRKMNSELLNALGLEMPTQEQLMNQFNQGSSQPDILHQFTYKAGSVAGGAANGVAIRNNTMMARNQGYQNTAKTAAAPASGQPGKFSNTPKEITGRLDLDQAERMVNN